MRNIRGYLDCYGRVQRAVNAEPEAPMLALSGKTSHWMTMDKRDR
jgi:hypothetical protein